MPVGPAHVGDSNNTPCKEVREPVEDGDSSVHVACAATTWKLSEIQAEDQPRTHAESDARASERVRTGAV